jgi:hypothetical protein
MHTLLLGYSNFQGFASFAPLCKLSSNPPPPKTKNKLLMQRTVCFADSDSAMMLDASLPYQTCWNLCTTRTSSQGAPPHTTTTNPPRTHLVLSPDDASRSRSITPHIHQKRSARCTHWRGCSRYLPAWRLACVPAVHLLRGHYITLHRAEGNAKATELGPA